LKVAWTLSGARQISKVAARELDHLADAPAQHHGGTGQGVRACRDQDRPRRVHNEEAAAFAAGAELQVGVQRIYGLVGDSLNPRTILPGSHRDDA
jgi:hypothetical protein